MNFSIGERLKLGERRTGSTGVWPSLCMFTLSTKKENKEKEPQVL